MIIPTIPQEVAQSIQAPQTVPVRRPPVPRKVPNPVRGKKAPPPRAAPQQGERLQYNPPSNIQSSPFG